MHGERQTLAAVPPAIAFRPVEGSLDHRTWVYLPLSESENDADGTRILAVEEMIEPHNCQRRRAGDACAAPVRLRKRKRAFGVYAFVEVAKAYECAECSKGIEQYTVAIVTTIKRQIHDIDLDDTPSEVVTVRLCPNCAMLRNVAVSRSASAFVPRWWRGKLTP
jgi:hypothetical protein